jgi:hypothetical protein
MANSARTDPVKVLFIAGSGRSGSTIVDNILGQVPGFCSVGELRWIWERGYVDGRPCACGLTLRECPFWSRALAEAFGDPSSIDPRRMMALQHQGARVRYIPRMLGSTSSQASLIAGMSGYPASMARLYAAVRDTSQSRVIVDSSKLPAYGFVVSKMPQVDLRVLHLVRDPRAAAFSWQRSKPAPDRAEGTMQRQGVARSAALWTIWNWTAEKLWSADASRYLRVRYEEFVRSPQPVLEGVLGWIGEAGGKLPFEDPRTVKLEPTHSVAGNPSRFTTGEVALKDDDEWKARMPASQRFLVTGITLPMLHRFGYRASGAEG